jgi:hypothetical protein
MFCIFISKREVANAVREGEGEAGTTERANKLTAWVICLGELLFYVYIWQDRWSTRAVQPPACRELTST